MSSGSNTKKSKLLNKWPQILGGASILLLSTLILLIIIGPRYPDLIDALGLNWLVNAQQGVFADCSKPENSKNAYCINKATVSDQSWKELSRSNSKPVPFSLSR